MSVVVPKYNNGSPQDPDLPLWRYLSLDRFRDLIESKSLYFAHTSKFSDRHEGVIPAQVIRSYLRHALGFEPFRYEGKDERESQVILNGILNILHTIPKQASYLSCWHHSDEESYLMWAGYANECKGVAVVSTPGNIYRATNFQHNELHMFFGNVSYYRPEQITDALRAHAYLFLKRSFYKAENEYRIALTEFVGPDIGTLFDKTGDHVRVQVDLSVLIKEVYVSPGTSIEDKLIVENLLLDAGLKIPVHQSHIDNPPLKIPDELFHKGTSI